MAKAQHVQPDTESQTPFSTPGMTDAITTLERANDDRDALWHPPAPSVSVIIATYNGSRYIREAIDSIRAQTLRPDEIVVVDDGSTDDTPEILRSYGDAIVVLTQVNKGHSAARNAGLSVAKGRYIALMDHDDTCKPERLERQWRALMDNPDAVACFTGHWLFSDAGWERDCVCDVSAGRRDALEYSGQRAFPLPNGLL